jgi:heme exporter protein B
MIQKDLTREIRAQHVWPRTLLRALVLVLLQATQVDLPVEQEAGVVGGLLWITIFFSGTLAIERSFASEHEGGCWQALLLYPIAPSALFLAKLLTNFVSIIILQLAVIPLFIVLTDVRLLDRPGSLALIVVLGSVGFASVGTLIGALTAGLRNRGGLLALLLLPLVAPILLSSAEATRIVLASHNDPLWWWWTQLLATFAVVFTVVGAMAFSVVMEE